MNRRDAKSAEKEPDPELNGLAGKVIGAAIAVHRVLGPGYLESVYEHALAVELDEQQVPFVRQQGIAVTYRGRPVGEGRVDFLVDGRLVVEIRVSIGWRQSIALR
jgi:GxxExxY protein